MSTLQFSAATGRPPRNCDSSLFPGRGQVLLPRPGRQSLVVCSQSRLRRARAARASSSSSASSASNEDADQRTAAKADAGKQTTPSGTPRRNLAVILPVSALISSLAAPFAFPTAPAALAEEFTDMPALRGKDYGKPKMRYPDYVLTPTGLQYKDLKEGTGETPKSGDTVVIDWDGFTIGYYGRIFEARNKAKGGSFEGSEKDFYRFQLGANQVIPAFEEALTTMKVGAIRRIIVPPELGYPKNDFNQRGPKPITFSGQRALDFVLKNEGFVDKTLLFDIELLKIIPS